VVEPLLVRPAAFALVRTLDWFMAALPVEAASAAA
jgi:hypothetical protein